VRAKCIPRNPIGRRFPLDFPPSLPFLFPQEIGRERPEAEQPVRQSVDLPRVVGVAVSDRPRDIGLEGQMPAKVPPLSLDAAFTSSFPKTETFFSPIFRRQRLAAGDTRQIFSLLSSISSMKESSLATENDV